MKRQRVECEYCGRTIAMKASGELYKHRMTTPTIVPYGPYAGTPQPWCPGEDVDLAEEMHGEGLEA